MGFWDGTQFGRWAAQSAASLTGSGIIGQGAKAAALKTDRAVRNINRDVWSKVAAEIDSDARQGRYFGCYAVPRSALAENQGGLFNQGLGKSLKNRGFIAMYCKRPSVGGQLYADVAVFWGHKSTKLKSNDSYKLYAFDILTLYLAECIGHGCTDIIESGSVMKEVREISGLNVSKQEDKDAAMEWFSDNFIKMVATVVWKDVPNIMNFHIAEITDKSKLVNGILSVTMHFFGGTPTAGFKKYVVEKLDEYEETMDSSDSGDSLAGALRLVGSVFNNKS